MTQMTLSTAGSTDFEEGAEIVSPAGKVYAIERITSKGIILAYEYGISSRPFTAAELINAGYKRKEG